MLQRSTETILALHSPGMLSGLGQKVQFLLLVRNVILTSVIALFDSVSRRTLCFWEISAQVAEPRTLETLHPGRAGDVLGILTEKGRQCMSCISDRELPQKPIKVEIGKATHKGMVRTHNEDSLISLVFPFSEGSEQRFLGFYAIADGLGGYEGGEVASSLALRMLAENIGKSLLLPRLKGETHGLNQELALQVLTEGVETANNEVYTQGKGSNMGTTLAAVLLLNKTAYIANVGDSRVYLLDGGQIRQITKDHSLVAKLVEVGEITPEEIYTHPRRNIITRYMGMQQDIEVDLFAEVLKPNTSLILCSDGLWEMVRDNEIKDIVLKADNAQTASKKLVEVANRNGGVDNISVVVVKVVG